MCMYSLAAHFVQMQTHKLRLLCIRNTPYANMHAPPNYILQERERDVLERMPKWEK
jgi:hypothetical protein